MRGMVRAKDIKCSANGECGPDLKWDLKDNILFISGNGDFSDFVSPWYAFRSIIEHVHIEGNVTSIGEYSFYNCNALRSINIPDSVKKIGSYAFYSCYSLKSVSIENSVIEIGVKAFDDCPDLTVICQKGSYVDGYTSDKSLKVIYK